VIPLNYAYKPGHADDGVTLDVNVRDAAALTPAALDWAIPGYTQDKVEHYLRSLPKELRKAFVPLSETVPAVTKAVEQLARLRNHGQTLMELMKEHLRERFGFRFEANVWDEKPLPEHLRVRVRVSDDEGRELCASRELAEVQALLSARQKELSAASVHEDPPVWRQARNRWERPEAEHWAFGDLPSSVVIGEQAGLPLLAFTALRVGSLGVSLRLVRTEAEADALTRAGLSRLLELQLGRELMWLERDLKQLRELGPQLTLIAPLEQLQADLFSTLRTWLLAPTRIQVGTTEAGPLHTKAAFDAAVERTREEMQGLVPRLIEQLREVVELRQVLSMQGNGPAGLAAEVLTLLPPDFLRCTSYERLLQLGRYMRAKKLRVERWRQNPHKDAERARLLAPYAPVAARHGRHSRFYWLVEEYRVSVFAQELGTAESVSPVKLDAEMKELPAVPLPPPAPAAPAPAGSALRPSGGAGPVAPRPAVPSPATRAQHAAEQAAAQAAAKAIALLGKPSVNSPLRQLAEQAGAAKAGPGSAPTPSAPSGGRQPLKSLNILDLPGLPAAIPGA
jgi:ATP-dependent helicase HrpA